MRTFRKYAGGGTAAALLCFLSLEARGQGVQTAGDVFNNPSDVVIYVLPLFTLGVTLGARDYAGTWQFSESVGTAMGMTAALKYTVRENRPNGDPQSFPSGHTAITVTSAEFLRKRYGWKFGLPAYALSAYVGYERIKDKEHYSWDVAAGAAISFAATNIFTRPYKGWTVGPAQTSRGLGVQLTRAF